MKKQFILFVLSIPILSFAAVNDMIPTDYEAMSAGTTIMSVNYISKDLDKTTIPTANISQQTLALRYSHGLDVGGKILALSFALPYTKLSMGNTENYGDSDVVLSSTYWYKADRKNKEYLASNISLSIPTGEYDKTNPYALNTGENRYKATFSIGYISKISEDFILELSPEIAMYSKNKTTEIEQKPSFAINSNIRYKPNNKYELFAGFQENYQSQTSKNGIDHNNEEYSEKYSLGVIYYTDRFNQFMIRAATEANKDFGFKSTDEILLRYRWWFR